MTYKIIRFGDRDGNGAIVEKDGWFSVTTWTANNDGKVFGKWVCRENGKFIFKGIYCDIDFFYKSQFDTMVAR